MLHGVGRGVAEGGLGGLLAECHVEMERGDAVAGEQRFAAAEGAPAFERGGCGGR